MTGVSGGFASRFALVAAVAGCELVGGIEPFTPAPDGGTDGGLADDASAAEHQADPGHGESVPRAGQVLTGPLTGARTASVRPAAAGGGRGARSAQSRPGRTDAVASSPRLSTYGEADP